MNAQPLGLRAASPDRQRSCGTFLRTTCSTTSTHQAGQLLAEALADQHARYDVLGVQKTVDVSPYRDDRDVVHIT